MDISEGFFKKHPQLFHYTTVESCFSIIDSQKLYASHHAFLNDRTELKAIEGILKKKSREVIVKKIERLKQKNDFDVQKVDEYGGVDKLIGEEVDNFYHVFYEGHMHSGVLKELLDTFIVSFCTHEKLGAYTRQNGLLSQWISYGGTAGCGLVFDTKKLAAYLNEEEDKCAIIADIFEMIYLEEGMDLDFIFPDFSELLANLYDCYLMRDKESSALDKFLPKLIEMATGLKHQAFYSENEVRISVVPIENHRDDRGRDPKIVRYRMKRDIPIPYIELFTDSQKQLSIEKIVVGPARDQARICRALERRCAPLGIEILCSQTPLVV